MLLQKCLHMWAQEFTYMGYLHNIMYAKMVSIIDVLIKTIPGKQQGFIQAIRSHWPVIIIVYPLDM